MGHLDGEWAREARRLHERYVVEVVEAYGLCPWAQRARLDGQTRASVVLDADHAAVGPSIGVLDQWTADGIEIGFLLYPRLRLGRLEFDGFTARLRSLHAERRTQFALAAFHPDAEADVDDPERLVPFLRRTPDPCVQAIRMSALERVRRGTPAGTQFIDVASLDESLTEEGGGPPLRDRIARANLQTVRREGARALEARFEAIQKDRTMTYGALEAREDGSARTAK